MRQFLLSFLLFCGGAGLFASPLEFYRENLAFTLAGDSLRVDGQYYFRNTSAEPLRETVFYPFPKDGGAISNIVCTNPAGKNIGHPGDRQGIPFTVTIPAVDSLICHIAYTQAVTGDSIRYILVTTQSWGKPLEWVDFQLDTKLPGVVTSYPPQQVEQHHGHTHSTWHYENFWPQHDMVFTLPPPSIFKGLH